MEPIYAIVHESSLYMNEPEYPGLRRVVAELLRIKADRRDCVSVSDLGEVPFGLDVRRPIKLCGAYFSGDPVLPMCADMYEKFLRDLGCDVEIHMKGTLMSDTPVSMPYERRTTLFEQAL